MRIRHLLFAAAALTLSFAAGCGNEAQEAAAPTKAPEKTEIKATATPVVETKVPGWEDSEWNIKDDGKGDASGETGEEKTVTPTPTPVPDSIYDVLQVSSDRKFTTYVFSITGKPSDLTLRPDGIFYGKNYEKRGRESEREIHLDVWDPNGKLIISQNCGIRIFGAYSRQSYLKSVKLFARSEYDAEHKNFKYNFFDTLKLDGSDGFVKKYKKLVLRNSGNDYQFAWIRDELCQTLASLAGFDDYEAVKPAVYYLNGEYKGLYWLHESYCDNYFKNKYGDTDKNGEFVVCEGSEQEKKTDDDDESTVKAANEFNAKYEQLKNLDYTIDSNYELLNSFMDVENYLMYYAYNTYICNHDWPNNNYKCYRYYAPEGEAYEADSVYDGRWRFLLHDMDYGMGLYDQSQCMASYDKLGEIMSPTIADENDKKKQVENERYAPLFTALMKRTECRDFFVKYSLELANNALSRNTICDTLDVMNEERAEEMEEFYAYLEVLKAKRADGIWAWRGHWETYTKQIKNFAKQRGNYSKRYMEKNFNISIE